MKYLARDRERFGRISRQTREALLMPSRSNGVIMVAQGVQEGAIDQV